MANPEEGQVSFEAGGKTWTMEITNRTERALQKRLKRPMGQVVSGLAAGDIEDLLAVFVESLKKHHADLNEEEAIDMVKPGRLRELVTELLGATYPSKEEENPPKPDQTTATGSAN